MQHIDAEHIYSASSKRQGLSALPRFVCTRLFTQDETLARSDCEGGEAGSGAGDGRAFLGMRVVRGGGNWTPRERR
ncbi:hypothetical protein E2C01_098785 [Portunus trituberculatus]|uniref:Uncharacterized protein n=1 Tax=Portunus trituberculatus TaxID=210409 RepID=A0A5B7K238_PORTR|nr:hypothetical protein [Portunus trituberculatus]